LHSGQLRSYPGLRGDKETLAVKPRLSRLEGTNCCTHFLLPRGQHFGEDDNDW